MPPKRLVRCWPGIWAECEYSRPMNGGLEVTGNFSFRSGAIIVQVNIYSEGANLANGHVVRVEDYWGECRVNIGCGRRIIIRMKAAEQDKVTRKNIVVIGDGAVGKSSLLFAYQNGSLVPSYTPTMWVWVCLYLSALEINLCLSFPLDNYYASEFPCFTITKQFPFETHLLLGLSLIVNPHLILSIKYHRISSLWIHSVIAAVAALLWHLQSHSLPSQYTILTMHCWISVSLPLAPGPLFVQLIME